jgi:hypothetical protein
VAWRGHLSLSRVCFGAVFAGAYAHKHARMQARWFGIQCITCVHDTIHRAVSAHTVHAPTRLLALYGAIHFHTRHKGVMAEARAAKGVSGHRGQHFHDVDVAAPKPARRGLGRTGADGLPGPPQLQPAAMIMLCP